MTQATIHEAKTHLSRLIRQALDGEEVVIANRDKPLVRLEALASARPSQKFGGLRHWAKRKGKDFNSATLNRAIEQDFRQPQRGDLLPSK